MAGVYHFLVYIQIAPNTRLSIYTTTGARSAPVVMFIQTAVFRGSLHMHQEMVYTSHFFYWLEDSFFSHV